MSIGTVGSKKLVARTPLSEKRRTPKLQTPSLSPRYTKILGALGLVILFFLGRLAFDAAMAHHHGNCLSVSFNTNFLSMNFGLRSSEYPCP